MKNLLKALFPSKVPRELGLTSSKQVLPRSGQLKPLYECKLADLRGFQYHPVKYEHFIEPRIVFLYDHRWYINLQRNNQPTININPHIKALSEAYTKLDNKQDQFKATFCLSTESPQYQDLYGTIAKGALNSNLINLYNGTRELIESGKTSGQDFYQYFRECLNDMQVVKMKIL